MKNFEKLKPVQKMGIGLFVIGLFSYLPLNDNKLVENILELLLALGLILYAFPGMAAKLKKG